MDFFLFWWEIIWVYWLIYSNLTYCSQCRPPQNISQFIESINYRREKSSVTRWQWQWRGERDVTQLLMFQPVEFKYVSRARRKFKCYFQECFNIILTNQPGVQNWNLTPPGHVLFSDSLNRLDQDNVIYQDWRVLLAKNCLQNLILFFSVLRHEMFKVDFYISSPSSPPCYVPYFTLVASLV